METFSALLAHCARNSTVNGEFPSKRPVTRSFDVFFDMCLPKRLGDLRRHRAHYDVTVMVCHFREADVDDWFNPPANTSTLMEIMMELPLPTDLIFN